MPLAVLWSCCPKVSALGGSLSNLRHILMDDPEVKLSEDGSAVLVYNQEQGITAICHHLSFFIKYTFYEFVY